MTRPYDESGLSQEPRTVEDFRAALDDLGDPGLTPTRFEHRVHRLHGWLRQANLDVLDESEIRTSMSTVLATRFMGGQ